MDQGLKFEFSTANRIIFGSGELNKIGSLANSMGTRVLLVRGKSPQTSQDAMTILGGFDLDIVKYVVDKEPTIEMIQRGTDIARDSQCDLVIGIGGGSVLDAGKAIAALLTNKGDVIDYLEVIGSGKPLSSPPRKYIALPTTAGTGAEVTKNAVLDSPEHRIKVSLRSPMMFPDIALIDPELTHSMPPDITASTGLDALTQLIEAYVSKKANPMTDAVCIKGIRYVVHSLYPAFVDGKNSEARRGMALASLLGGIALANAKLGAVHGFAGPIGGMIHAPHGAICARLLPFVMEVNLKALRGRGEEEKYLRRYEEISKILIGENDAGVEDGIEWVEEMCQRIDIQPLSKFGLSEADIPEVLHKGKYSSSMQGNPIELTRSEMEIVLQKAL